MNDFTFFSAFYKKLFNSFNEIGIEANNNISTYFYGHWDRDLWGKNDFHYDNIKPLAWDVWDSRYHLKNEISKDTKSIFTINWKSNINWTSERRAQELLSIASASILLGEKTVVLTPNWSEYGDNDESHLDCPEIWDVMFTLKPLLLGGKIIVLPYTGIGHEAEQYTCRLPFEPDKYLEQSLKETKLITLGTDVTLEHCISYNNLEDYKKFVYKKKLSAILLPIVKVDNLERLIEFSDKYSVSLNRFRLALDSLIQINLDNPGRINEELLQSVAELDDRFKMYSKEVNKKSIKLIIQSAAFISSLLFPGDISKVIAALTGSATLFDSIELIATSKNAIYSTKEHYFWFPWAWNRHYLK